MLTAALISAILVAAVVLLSAGNFRLQVEKQRTAAEYNRAEDERATANAERAEAESRLRFVLQALDEVFVKQARSLSTLRVQENEARVAPDPRREKAEREFFEKGLHFYEQLAQRPGTSPEARFEMGRALYSIAHIRIRLGHSLEAERAWRQATRLFGELSRQFPEVVEYAVLQADACQWLYVPLANIGRNDEAEQVTREALAIFQRVAIRDPNDRRTRRGLARCHCHLSRIEAESGRLAEALDDLKLADNFCWRLAADFPSEADYLEWPPEGRLVLGQYLEKSGRQREAIELFGEAAATYERLVADTMGDGGRARTTRNSNPFTASDSTWYRHELGYACVWQGSILRDLGQLPEAEAALRRALKVHASLVADVPSRADYKARLAWNQTHLARVRKARGDRLGAEQVYRDALAVAEDISVGHEHVAKVYEELIELYQEDGRLTEAVEVRSKAVAAWGKRAAETNAADDRRCLADEHRQLARLLEQSGDNEAAVAAYRKARDLWHDLVHEQPGSVDCFQYLYEADSALSRALTSAGRVAEALQPLLSIADLAEKRLHDSPEQWRAVREIHIGLAKFFFAAGRIREGAKAFDLAIEQNPEEPAVWGRRGEFYARLGLWERASQDIAMDCRFGSVKNPHQWLAHALLSLELGDLAAYQEICRRLPDVFKTPGDCAGLENELVRACCIAPTPDADLGWALRMSESAAKGSTEAAWEQFALGLARYRAGDCEGAVTAISKSTSWQAGCLSQPALALAYHGLGRAQEAREALNRATESINRLAENHLWTAVGTMPMFPHDWLSALLLYREATTVVEGRAPADDFRQLAAQARSWAALGEAKAADEACRRALELGAENIQVCLACAMTHAELGRQSEAEGALASAARLWPDSARHLRLLAFVASKLGKYFEAIAAYGKAIELAPDNAVAHNDLAWLYATCPAVDLRDPARAVALAKKAVELKPADGAGWNTLGAAQYRAGDWQAAIDALSKSMELREGGDAFDWFFLAMARWQQGDKDQARKLHAQAIAWMAKSQPNDEELNRFRAEAEELVGKKEP